MATSQRDVTVIILAAGDGTRMRSSTPKVLHKIGGQTLLQRVLHKAKQLAVKDILLVHNPKHHTSLAAAIDPSMVTWIRQEQALGTGHAVLQALGKVRTKRCLILYGDVPLVPIQLLESLLDKATTGLGMITASTDQPDGFGRIIRNDKQQIQAIIEQKDACQKVAAIQEINTGMMCIPTTFLETFLPQLQAKNAQGEYYLTDCVAQWQQTQPEAIVSVQAETFWHVQGINSVHDLVQLERIWMRHRAHELIRSGVCIRDPNRFELYGDLHCGKDVVIEPNCQFYGTCVIGDNCNIASHSSLHNVHLEDNVCIKSHCVLEDTKIKSGARVGPFAYTRPHTQVGTNAKLGSFVETKNTQIGDEASVAHFAYVGDTEIGRRANVGAMFVNANFHGHSQPKSTARIGEGAAIGAQVVLVGNISIGEFASIGAGSTIRGNTKAYSLTVTKGQTVVKEQWRPNHERAKTHNKNTTTTVS